MVCCVPERALALRARSFLGAHAFGGPLNEAHISATAELVVRCLPGSTERRFDDEVGLNLIAF